ncbi:TolC family outer membrane protein [Parasulfitobacter algicola]|uniref:TolC family outer membrane protein n=1 Tax=Parasulfitobacter algicola TaxID=2614809 RepID=UPI0031B5D10F
MTYKLRFGTAIVAIFIAASAQAETLTDALIGAYKNSGLLDQQQAVLRAADENVAEALAGLRPVVNYTMSAGYGGSSVFTATTTDTWSLSASLGISADITVFDNGQTKYAVNSAKENVLATREALVSVEQQILLRAVSAYMSVRSEVQTVGLRQNNVRVITEQLRAARDRFEVGEITRTDVAQAEARLAAARSNLAAAQGQLARAREEYRNAVGRMPGNLAQPPALAGVPQTEQAATQFAERNHPEIRRAQRLVSASDLDVLRAKAALGPTVGVSAGVQLGRERDGAYGLPTNNDTDTRSQNLSITLNQPIYQGGRLSSLIRQAMARRDQQRAGLHIVVHDIRQNVGNSYADLRVARASLAASREQVRAARVAFEGVREEATLGARTTLDVLDAEQELLNAQNDLIDASTQEYVAYYSVLSSMGLLTADYLNLGIQTYDPQAYYNLVKDGPVNRSSQGQRLDRVLRALGKE